MKRQPPLDPEGFAAILPVSRETLERLSAWLDLLRRWQSRINLVGASTLRDPWRRHILDCAQLVRYLPPAAQRLVDLGSGAGLPGLVLAILGVPEVHLVESDRRKAAFLLECKGRLGLAGVVVHPVRAEALPPFPADVVTARALAPLPRLLPLAARFAAPHTRFLFLKGREAESELTEALRRWTMTARIHPSLSSEEGRILEIEGLRPREPGRDASDDP
ncbi:MAG: 16S rRNA (guanine(527)-N(7))-methyltransferase RsmG [Geminicoccaceae bacterium]|nr:16S rRNA (guanine(527)-N(7))-methyltransferase RsmG [Geminicoccaceae bacterium]